MKKIPHKLFLSEEQIPRQWYNLRADMKEKPDPLLNPRSKEDITISELGCIFCRELAEQELNSSDRYIDIPNEVRDCYKIYRPSPLIRAYELEKALKTPAKIYYKFEGNNVSGSHKLNSAIPQAYYAKKQGVESLTTETGAGQWGTALAQACAYFGLDLTVFMVRASYNQKPYRKTIMQTFGANVTSSPSDTTESGKRILLSKSNENGSLGCAISEAVEMANNTPNCRYVLGSVLNQVLLHQSIIGLECKAGMEMIDEYPDVIIGCAGGGSSLGGLIAPFMRDKILNRTNTKFIAVEPVSCPSFTQGRYIYDYCDTAKITPMAKMYSLGCDFIPPADHAGGLRYHGMSPILSKLYHDGYISALAVNQMDVFNSAMLFAQREMILPAPESSHAINVAIREAIRCREEGRAETILFCLTGTGYFDMLAYEMFMNNRARDCSFLDRKISLKN